MKGVGRCAVDSKEQWALVAQIRERLAHDDHTQVGYGLEESWRNLQVDTGPFLKREDAKFSEFVLPSIVSWIKEIDDYPPPELLIALCVMFQRYLDAAGTLKLENALFGKPKQRTGAYAARRPKRDDVAVDIGFAFAYRGGKNRGMSDAAAAAYAQNHVEVRQGKCPDAETMLKRMRRARARTK